MDEVQPMFFRTSSDAASSPDTSEKYPPKNKGTSRNQCPQEKQ
jgi:hypothetical protein